MPQELHVVRCYSCETFQVDIIKKVPKWTCKMCGEKQSLKKIYGKGTGGDCRNYVQELNRQRLVLRETDVPEDANHRSIHMDYVPKETNTQKRVEIANDTAIENSSRASKWMQFMNEEMKVDVEETDNNFDDSYPATSIKIVSNAKMKAELVEGGYHESDESIKHSCNKQTVLEELNQRKTENIQGNTQPQYPGSSVLDNESKWVKVFKHGDNLDTRKFSNLNGTGVEKNENVCTKNSASVNENRYVVGQDKWTNLFDDGDENVDFELLC